jgi:hypothetical protein
MIALLTRVSGALNLHDDAVCHVAVGFAVVDGVAGCGVKIAVRMRAWGKSWSIIPYAKSAVCSLHGVAQHIFDSLAHAVRVHLRECMSGTTQVLV